MYILSGWGQNDSTSIDYAGKKIAFGKSASCSEIENRSFFCLMLPDVLKLKIFSFYSKSKKNWYKFPVINLKRDLCNTLKKKFLFPGEILIRHDASRKKKISSNDDSTKSTNLVCSIVHYFKSHRLLKIHILRRWKCWTKTKIVAFPLLVVAFPWNTN